MAPQFQTTTQTEEIDMDTFSKGRSMVQPPQAIDQTDIDRTNSALDTILKRVAVHNDRLSGVVSRIYGADGNGKEAAGRPQAAGTMGTQGRLLSDISDALDINDSLISQIQRLG